MSGLKVLSSSGDLKNACEWAIPYARSQVMTGRRCALDQHEFSEQASYGTAIPCYRAGYLFRSAFYARDFCHQAAGAHLLGLHAENRRMLSAFAASATPEREWYPLWALNFDGSPFLLDYRDDRWFVREVPAVFELVETCERLYRWTGDTHYLLDATIRRYCEQAVTEFIRLHDTRIPNGVAEGDGSGDIFRGVATYSEQGEPLLEAGDGLACEFQALNSWARLCVVRGDCDGAVRFAQRAARLRNYFETDWSVHDDVDLYVCGYDVHEQPVIRFGLERSWFMPLKGITRPSARLDRYLDFIERCVDAPASRPPNVEACTYLPELFFQYGRADTAWRWLMYTANHPDREYPEVSFTLISTVVERMLGLAPHASQHAFATQACLPEAVEYLAVSGIPLGAHSLDIEHHGACETVARQTGTDHTLEWEARFAGAHTFLRVDGQPHPAIQRTLYGAPVSAVIVRLTPDRPVTVSIR